ncbi:hypothetical protein D918_08202 [Trichuris suis]|nr:hypothetical protein D918_08202 [Trichuris suis]
MSTLRGSNVVGWSSQATEHSTKHGVIFAVNTALAADKRPSPLNVIRSMGGASFVSIAFIYEAAWLDSPQGHSVITDDLCVLVELFIRTKNTFAATGIRENKLLMDPSILKVEALLPIEFFQRA